MQSIRQRQRTVQETLDAIQTQLYTLENRYLEETGSTGNVVRGWDGYIDSKPRMLTFRRDVKLRASERIFSYSSVTSPIPPEDIARELAAPSPTSKRSKSSYMNNGDGYNRASQRKKKKKRRADLDEEYEG